MPVLKNPVGDLTIGVFFCLLSTNALADSFLTRDQNPLTLFQGQPLPLDTSTTTALQIETSIDIANTLNVQTAGTHSLYLDFESYYLNIRLSGKLSDDSHWLIDVPLVHRGGGFLDSAIDSWHETFGLPRANRPNVAENQYSIYYSVGANTEIDLSGNDAGLGDVSLNLAYSLMQSSETDIAFWAGIELPTGSVDSLLGNDAVDAHLSVTTRHRFNPSWHADVQLGVVLPGGDRFTNNRSADTTLYSYLSTDWQANDWLVLRIQFESHQSYYENSDLDMLDATNIIVFGGGIIIDRCSRIDFGVSEDIDVASSPDVSFLFSWRKTACQ